MEQQSLESRTPDSRSEAAENEINASLSGHPDLARPTPAQIDGLEQAFQQAITNDRRLRRSYINLGVLYAYLPK